MTDKSPSPEKVAGDVQLTPLVASGDRQHLLDRACWCSPRVLRRYWGDQDVVVHRPARIDGSTDG